MMIRHSSCSSERLRSIDSSKGGTDRSKGEVGGCKENRCKGYVCPNLIRTAERPERLKLRYTVVNIYTYPETAHPYTPPCSS